MKLRWQLVLSHLAAMVVYAVLIGAISFFLLLKNIRAAEEQNLDSAAATASQTLLNRVEDLQAARDAVAGLAASFPPRIGGIEETIQLHDACVRYRLERVEVFRGLKLEAHAYRWERGVGPGLATTWLPTNPRVAAQVAGGRPATWIQRSAGGVRALKLCTPIPNGGSSVQRWVVVTEPLDASLVERIIPPDAIGALRDQRGVLVAWPEPVGEPVPTLTDLEQLLHPGPLTGLFSVVAAHRAALQLDDGSTLSVDLLASPVRSGEVLLNGLRAWFLVLATAVVLAFVLGTGLANRILSPLRALLEGTAAMARGHLMVRLPVSRRDELGALTREFNRMADEIRNTYLGVISTLAEVVEAKSHYTREHIERVERLSMATADLLERRGWVKFSGHQRFLLSVAAILHDVGKIAIGNEILNKSGPLDAAERAQILSHPNVGALIVERMGKLERAAEIIRCAHEHFDGSGYPRGLRGEEIPLESRIILAVDALDAMTMNRPYSRSRTLQDGITELRSEAGRQFDPVVVEALVEVVSSESKPPAGETVSDSGLYRAIHPVTRAGAELPLGRTQDS